MCQIRNLRADEIECRPKQVYENSVMVLLYKDARCDMKILDETFGVYGWERTHDVINGNLFCSVRIRNPETGEWIIKQDVGTESNTEKEKGEASDSFKRACTNVGIGRELYSAPPIWIKLKADEIGKDKSNKDTVKNGVHFYVSEIKTDEDKQIIFLKIIDKKGEERFEWAKTKLEYHELKAEDTTQTEAPTETQPKQNVQAIMPAISSDANATSVAMISTAGVERIKKYILDNVPETKQKAISTAVCNKWKIKNTKELKECDVDKFLEDIREALTGTAA